jgi:cell division protein FtsI (penicillin-binding protein 3)
VKNDVAEVMRHDDPKLEAAITELLGEELESYKTWSKAVVCVVETQTGIIKANVAYERKGKRLVPCTDTYDREQEVMECGSTYLALMASGRVTPEHVFDTGYGVYGEVRDHNWRRGGYGAISLDRALEVRSQVAFTMAKERVYGGNTAVFEAEINKYLAGNPNNAMGLLAFYNAVANNGKMVKLVSEGDYGTTILEQIAQPQYIEELQTGLEHCVSQGLMRKAGRAYVKVSACGRTFIVKGNHRRMELYGYFPSDDPQYTIMVILEKDGLPASAGGMCGPIFAQTVDLLVEKYQLQPMLARQYEDVDEVIEIVDTVAVAN